jgi:catechol 2,3-dioxygenase-like lactoylglutathione lyase family enzyme
VDLNHLNLPVGDVAASREFYERHFGFRLAYEAEGGCFERNDDGFLLALMPAARHVPLPAGFHIGFGLHHATDVAALHSRLTAAGVPTSPVDDARPDMQYVTFRCWDPDGTEVEVFWEEP